MRAFFLILAVAVQLQVLHGAMTAPHVRDSGVSVEDAWSLFARVNRPVSAAQNSLLEWETWALTREVYSNPDEVPNWEDARNGDRFHAFLMIQKKKFKEIRMNHSAFRYVAENDLYFVEGQMEMHRQERPIVFPDDACHVSVLWQLIDPDEEARFHSVSVDGPGGEKQLWGVAAMHIAIKENGDWLWTTWEHRSNPNLDPARRASNLFFPENLSGTVWENYVLVGTQSDFVDSVGRPTLLANSELEIGFERNTSSCITCHARASISDRYGDLRLPVLESRDPRRGSVGEPDPDWFYEAVDLSGRTELKFTQTDFVWSLKRASARRTSGTREEN